MKQILKPENFEKLSRFIGNPDEPFKHRAIYTAIVWSPNERHASLQEVTHNHIIIMNEKTPKFPDDFFFYRWARYSSRAVFQTASVIKSSVPSETVDFAGNDDMEKYANDFGTGQPQKQRHFIISKTLDCNTILNHGYYQLKRYQKVIFQTPQMSQEQVQSQEFQQFIQANDITLAPHFQTVREQFKFTLEHAEHYPVINDLGPQCVEETLDLLDYLVLTIYRGNLDKEFVGGEMPKISKVLELFNVVYESEEYPQGEGYIRFYVFIRK